MNNITEMENKIEDKIYFIKHEGDKIFWLYNRKRYGDPIFSFDKVDDFHLFLDYPWKLTKEQKELFDKENPFWANFYKNRKMEDKPTMR